MATSESDDFESADEELSHDVPVKRGVRSQQWSSPTVIDSESDDDTEYVPRTPCTNSNYCEKSEKYSSAKTAAAAGERTPAKDVGSKENNNDAGTENVHGNETDKNPVVSAEKNVKTSDAMTETADSEEVKSLRTETDTKDLQVKKGADSRDEDSAGKTDKLVEKEIDQEVQPAIVRSEHKGRERQRTQRKTETSRQLGARKLGTRITHNDNDTANTDKTVSSVKDENVAERMEKLSLEETTCNLPSDTRSADFDTKSEELFKVSNEAGVSIMDELAEPEELKSDKKFKDIFKPQGWEGLGTDIELPEELTEEKLQPVLERLSSAGQESESTSGNWGGWGSWGVSSLINTATAGVSTLTSHMSHGLTLLEESMGGTEETEPIEIKEKEEQPIADDKKANVPEESPSQISFGFGNLISGVSSITRLVESTGTKVMAGGLDTLEAIGKKTMEVLQEGDPGLKKKRAFFTNEPDKPNLSQVLREAKEKAETAEKTLEEKQLARKVHFESLFDDYQGLVHLEALEMLSKQSNIKIQQYLVGLEIDELTSIQETLEEVKELCDLGDEDEDEDEDKGGKDERDTKDLKLRFEEACKDLGIIISYEKLHTVWEESQSYLDSSSTHISQEVFQKAISALAQFTAFSVERFHKTAELLLIKERRSTVNEADAMVKLTRILSNQIEVIADRYCDFLNESMKNSEKSENIKGNITTIFLEATNASSYIQDAFRLLIPIIQVGII